MTKDEILAAAREAFHDTWNDDADWFSVSPTSIEYFANLILENVLDTDARYWERLYNRAIVDATRDRMEYASINYDHIVKMGRMSTRILQLQGALEEIKLRSISLADAQVTALEALK